MNKNFLPSKKFVHRLLIIIAVLAVVLSISQLIKFLKNKNSDQTVVTTKVVAKNLIVDSNDNGIPDWEERLWGMNPNKNGEKNKEFILSKRATLNQENTVLDNIVENSEIAENETLARDFFALVMAMGESGELNEESMQSLSDLVGEKIESTPIEDIYTQNMLTIKGDSPSEKSLYYENLKKLTEKYQDANIGDELSLIAQGLINENPQAPEVATSIALAYQSFGKALIEIPVPESFSLRHLSLANNYEKTGQSLLGLTKLLSEPVTGMKALINYKKYNDALVSDWQYMADNL